MRSPTEVNCSRGYEWPLMKAAVKRNPSITLYGLPWGWPGWLGGGNTTNPFHDPSASADYIARWVECGRDTHGLNISMLGIHLISVRFTTLPQFTRCGDCNK